MVSPQDVIKYRNRGTCVINLIKPIASIPFFARHALRITGLRTSGGIALEYSRGISG